MNITDPSAGSVQLSGAKTEGGTVAHLIGSNFGPSSSTTKERYVNPGEIVQSITYGPASNPSLYVLPPENWVVLSHEEIKVTLLPGVGQGLHFVVEVADQKSNPSSATFSYALPEVVSITPTNASTFQDPRTPLRAKLCGINFPVLDSKVETVVFLGNEGDSTLSEPISASKMPFDPAPNAMQCV